MPIPSPKRKSCKIEAKKPKKKRIFDEVVSEQDFKEEEFEDESDDDDSHFEDYRRQAEQTKIAEEEVKPTGQKTLKCMIFSDDELKMKWDLFIVVLLVLVCLVIPYRLAFAKKSFIWELTYYFIDFLFFVDIILTFMTTIPDKDKTS